LIGIQIRISRDYINANKGDTLESVVTCVIEESPSSIFDYLMSQSDTLEGKGIQSDLKLGLPYAYQCQSSEQPVFQVLFRLSTIQLLDLSLKCADSGVAGVAGVTGDCGMKCGT
ncbi:MAG: hypothetical protein EZS28_027376, partial [Streblomastix strix]